MKLIQTIQFLCIAILLISCAKTQVVRLDDPNYVQEPLKNEIIASEKVPIKETISTTIAEPAVEEKETTSKSSSSSSSKSSTTKIVDNSEIESDETFDPSQEYSIESCCTEGILYAKAKKDESAYSIQQKQELLLEIYYENCDEFNNQRNGVNLKYTNGNSDFLVSYLDAPQERKISISNVIVNKEFSMCS